MFGFWRKRTYEDPKLGRFEHAGRMWHPSGLSSGLGVSLEGGVERPEQKAIEVARELMQSPGQWIGAAKDYVCANPHALKFMDGSGELICDGFTVYQSGQFAVEFSLTDWPDAMITVPFKDGAPCEVQLGD
ncbi:hypothetical protein ACFONG_19415 [Uliginosibacterium paludis]|uniref:Uncharacterized protein n=1 Tax=Uliginosibacterium paludis TaxID=1615952 RepID=A0ABV2CUE6_9RHOO